MSTMTAFTNPEIAEVANLIGIDTRTSYHLSNFATFLGRSIDNDIVSSDLSLSRRHACISKINGIYYLRDLRSSNGTLLNGVSVQAMVALKQNDEIYFGRSRFLFNPTTQKLHEMPPFGAGANTVAPASPWLQPKTFFHHLKTQLRKLVAGMEKQKNCLQSRVYSS